MHTRLKTTKKLNQQMLIAKRHAALLEAQLHTKTHTHAHANCVALMLCNASVYIKFILRTKGIPSMPSVVPSKLYCRPSVERNPSAEWTAIYHSWRKNGEFLSILSASSGQNTRLCIRAQCVGEWRLLACLNRVLLLRLYVYRLD